MVHRFLLVSIFYAEYLPIFSRIPDLNLVEYINVYHFDIVPGYHELVSSTILRVGLDKWTGLAALGLLCCYLTATLSRLYPYARAPGRGDRAPTLCPRPGPGVPSCGWVW